MVKFVGSLMSSVSLFPDNFQKSTDCSEGPAVFVVQQNLSIHQKSPLKLSKNKSYLHSFHALFLKQHLNNFCFTKPESGAPKNRLWLRHQSDRQLLHLRGASLGFGFGTTWGGVGGGAATLGQSIQAALEKRRLLQHCTNLLQLFI